MKKFDKNFEFKNKFKNFFVINSGQTWKAKGPGAVRFLREDISLRRVFDAGWHLSPFPFNDRKFDFYQKKSFFFLFVCLM